MRGFLFGQLRHYNIYMANRDELMRRLTGHLAGEASYDFHTFDDRVTAIKDAYLYISERWELWRKSTPADSLSPGERPNTWNSYPPDLADNNSMPWSGAYPQFHPLISIYAAYLIYSNKGPEMFERATYWKAMFDERAKEIDARLARSAHDEYMNSDASGETWGGMNALLRYYLGTSGMSSADAFRMFPDNIRQGALRRAYLEISEELEITVKTTQLHVPPAMKDAVGVPLALPADFIRPVSMAGFLTNGEGVIGAQFPYGQRFTPISSYSIARDGEKIFATVQNFKGPGVIEIQYVAKPSPLDQSGSKPWGGTYPTANKLIVLRAMRDMMRGKPETYNMSRFWENEYDRESAAVKKMLKKYRLGEANRVKVGHSADFGITENGFIPINYNEGNGGNR